MWPFTDPKDRRIQELETLVDQQAQIIHTLQVTLATLTGSPPPAPWPLRSRPPSPSSAPTPRAPRGAEAVSILDPKTRREREWVAEVSHPLPAYMKTQTAPDPDAAPAGFSPSPKPPPPPPAPSTPSEPS